MDSLTQIVLGAAAGEVVLGKKIGNRAMVWGAVGGTIPDMDVLGRFFLSKIDNVAFHRGISHSITFSVVGALVFGWLVHQLYKSRYHKWMAIAGKIVAAVVVSFVIYYLFSMFFPGNFIPVILVVSSLFILLYGHLRRSYFTSTWQPPKASAKDWQWLFFWALFTHPLLDCFTMYGTQLFAPFSDIRIAFSTISVADPLYTVPFLTCVIIASRLHRSSKKRRVWNYAGIALSSIYLLFTVSNKQWVNRVFTRSLERQDIPVERFITNPSILNNILWNCTAETKDYYYLGQYSLFDTGEIRFYRVEKNHSLLKNRDTDPVIRTLRWFSKDYYIVVPVGESYQLNDLRYGSLSGKASNRDDFLFRFLLTDRGKAGYQLKKTMSGPSRNSGESLFGNVWSRIWDKPE